MKKFLIIDEDGDVIDKDGCKCYSFNEIDCLHATEEAVIKAVNYYATEQSLEIENVQEKVRILEVSGTFLFMPPTNHGSLVKKDK